MSTWGDFVAAEPDLAARVRALFTAHTHHTMATLRKDGSPRISGTEVEHHDGAPGSHRFLIDLGEVVITRVGTPADHLVIETWHPGRGLRRIERR